MIKIRMYHLISLFVALLFLIVPSSFSQASNFSFSDVTTTKEWKITFNRAIDEKSVIGNVYLLKDTEKIPVITNVETNVLKVKPANALEYDTNYQLIVTNAVQDRAQKTIKNEKIISFTTEQKPQPQEAAAFLSEYSTMKWSLPTLDPLQLRLVGMNASSVVGGYETRKDAQLFGIKIGASKSTVQAKYGQPVDSILKGNTKYIQNGKDAYGNITSEVYFIDGNYVTFFYDMHKNYIVRSILWVSKETELSKPGFYQTNITTAFRDSEEALMAHLINQSRVAEGLQPLTYTPQYNNIARAHSVDMATNNFFSHTNLKGLSPFDRMDNGGLDYSYAGENIAYGQYSSIYAHEGLMNSKGHRDNILNKNYTHVIVGVAYDKNAIPYYTINFYAE